MATASLHDADDMRDPRILHLWRGRAHISERCPCCRKRGTQELRARLSALFRSRKYQQFITMSDDPWSSAIRAVYARAATDPDFRARCLQDAPAAIKEVSGLDVVGITFTETNESSGAGMMLPPFGVDPDEIDDLAALDTVAGGGVAVFANSLGC